MGIIVSSCLNETETEVVPTHHVRRVFYGTFLFYFHVNNELIFISD